MVTVLHLMLERFHHFTELKKKFGNQTRIAKIYILSYNTITVQVISNRSEICGVISQ